MFRGAYLNRTVHLFRTTVINTAFKLRGDHRNIISVNQTVLIDITIADVSFKIGIALSQSCIIGIRCQVIAVNLTVDVNVSLKIAFRSGHLEYIDFLTGAVVADCFCNG